MKQEVFRIFDYQEKEKAEQFMAGVMPDGKTEVVFRNATISKTLAQLGGLFGVWINRGIKKGD